MNPNLNPFRGQPDPFLDPEGQPDPFEPENWAQIGLNPKKRVGFGRTKPEAGAPKSNKTEKSFNPIDFNINDKSYRFLTIYDYLTTVWQLK